MNYTFDRYIPSAIKRGHLRLGGENPSGERIDINSLYFERGKKPWAGVMGEYHFERDSRENWYTELCKMKAGGIGIVSTYVIWIYHEETEGSIDFTGDNDLRRFILDARKAGLDVLLRIGPWAHGEARNGGFPDWLLKKPFKLRDNNKDYLDTVKRFYTAIYEQVSDLFYKDGGNIIGVQVENELVDNAEHLARLREICEEIGYDVPLWTVTGWNSVCGARIPVSEFCPVFGGYIETPWSESKERLEPSMHYFFNKMRNDTAIGADIISSGDSDSWQLPYDDYPFATCELGAGTQNTHHRRARIGGMDIYAMSLVKLGSGNNLIGYYMYHGGINKIGKYSTFQESRDTGYPNDLPVMSYDFQAPLSEYGEVREQYRLLNMLHMFVNDFGDKLAPTETVLPINDIDRFDKSSLRYAMRTDGKSGFVFVNHYQRFDRLDDVKDVVFDTGIVKFPQIDVKGPISFFMPFNMELGDMTLTYATAQPLCKVGDTYFFVEINGVTPQYSIDGKTYTGKLIRLGELKIATLTEAEARYARKLDGRLYIGIGCDLYDDNGVIRCIEPGDYVYAVWDGEEFSVHEKKEKFAAPHVYVKPCDPPFEIPYPYEMNIGGERDISWYSIAVDSPDGFADIYLPCDCMQIYADGELINDEFFFGESKRIPARLLYAKECYAAVSEMRDDFYREF